MLQPDINQYYVVSNTIRDGISLKDLLNIQFNITDVDLARYNVDLNAVLDAFDNTKAIFEAYSNVQKFQQKKANIDYLAYGTLIKFPQDILQTLIPAFEDKQDYFPFQDTNAFIADEVKKIIYDDRYKPIVRHQNYASQDVFSYIKQGATVGVYIYSRALDKLLNISPFVISQSSNNTVSGGNWHLSLPAITTNTGDLAQDWEAIKKNIIIFEYDNTYNFYFRDFFNYVGRAHTQEEALSIMIANMFFHLAIQPQDLVFLKFENLQIEDDNVKQKNFIEGSLQDLNLNYFDFIGLVDANKINHNPENGEVSIQIEGRCLSKLLLDDGVYFFPGSNGANGFSSQYFGNRESIKDDPAFKRIQRAAPLRIAGTITDLTLFTQQNLRTTINYILGKMSAGLSVFSDAVINGIGSATSANNATGVWRLTKLHIDPVVENRKLVNSNLATARGVSLYQLFKSVCQEPFVELLMDTYGTNFHFIVRQPPFTRNGFEKNYRLNIKTDSIINFDVNFDDNEGYGWYRIVPNGIFAGSSDFANFYFPAVFFPEFAKLFSTKPLDVQCQYIDFGAEQTPLIGYQQAYEDLRFLVETNVHLPFTRKGRITLSPGDRRIKRGMNIYLEATDELYYVDAVHNNYEITLAGVERTTVLQVSRGIVLSHIDKYFGLINYGNSPFKTLSNLNIAYQHILTKSLIEDRKINWSVNTDNLDFLLKRKQLNHNV